MRDPEPQFLSLRLAIKHHQRGISFRIRLSTSRKGIPSLHAPIPPRNFTEIVMDGLPLPIPQGPLKHSCDPQDSHSNILVRHFWRYFPMFNLRGQDTPPPYNPSCPPYIHLPFRILSEVALFSIFRGTPPHIKRTTIVVFSCRNTGSLRTCFSSTLVNIAELLPGCSMPAVKPLISLPLLPGATELGCHLQIRCVRKQWSTAVTPGPGLGNYHGCAACPWVWRGFAGGLSPRSLCWGGGLSCLGLDLQGYFFESRHDLEPYF